MMGAKFFEATSETAKTLDRPWPSFQFEILQKEQHENDLQIILC